MTRILAPLTALLLAGFAQAEDSYVLTKADSFPPGYEGTNSMMMKFKGDTSLNVAGQNMEFPTSSKSTSKISYKVSEAGEMSVLTVEDLDVSDSVLPGVGEQHQEQEGDLVGKTLTGKKVDGLWQLTGPEGAEQSAVDELVKAINHEHQESVAFYGTEARKVGETWPIDVSKLSSMGDLEDAKGDGTMTFDSIVEHEGRQCAKLTYVLKFSGKAAGEDGAEFAPIVSFDGKGVILRDLEYLVDTKMNFAGQMNMNAAQEGMTMSIKAPVEVEETTSVESPGK